MRKGIGVQGLGFRVDLECQGDLVSSFMMGYVGRLYIGFIGLMSTHAPRPSKRCSRNLGS